MKIIELSGWHLLLICMAAVATVTAHGDCFYGDQTYSHTSVFQHANGCAQLQCQYGDIVPVSDNCGKEIDGTCHHINSRFVYENKQYLCTKSNEGSDVVYGYLAQNIPKSARGCYVGKIFYKNGELAVSKDTCRIRQCQDGSAPFLVAACLWDRDSTCHPVDSIWVNGSTTYKCVISENNAFKITTIKTPPTPSPVPATPAPTTAAPAPTTASPAPTTAPCPDVQIDIMFLIDSSGSIGQDNYHYNFDFIKKAVEAFSKAVHFGLIIFGTTPRLKANLMNNKTEFYQILKNVEYRNSTTNTDKAIDFACTLLKAGRPGARRGIVLVTDGMSSYPDKTKQAAQSAKDEGMVIVVLAVGINPDKTELNAVASSLSLVYRVENYTALVEFAASISGVACNASLPLPPVKPCPPETPLAFIFVIDSSGSIGKENYELNFVFIRRFIGAFTIGAAETQFGLITYGTSAKTIFPLTANRDTIIQKLENVRYHNSTTNTDAGINLAVKLLEVAIPKSRKVILLVTDGLSLNPPKTLESAQRAKAFGALLAVIAVGDAVDEEELNNVASHPQYVYRVSNYTALTEFANNMSRVACNASTAPTTTAPPAPEQATTTPELTTVKPCVTAKKLDIYIAIDSSGSIGEDNYKFNFLFILQLLEAFFVDEQDSRFSLCTFGTSARPVFNQSSDKDFIKQKLQSVPYHNSTTNTQAALELIYDLATHGLSTDGYTLNLLLVTDGMSTVPEATLKAAQKLKDIGFTNNCVGVGKNVDLAELYAVASDPSRVNLVGEYSDLNVILGSIAEATCNGRQ